VFISQGGELVLQFGDLGGVDPVCRRLFSCPLCPVGPLNVSLAYAVYCSQLVLIAQIRCLKTAPDHAIPSLEQSSLMLNYIIFPELLGLVGLVDVEPHMLEL